MAKQRWKQQQHLVRAKPLRSHEFLKETVSEEKHAGSTLLTNPHGMGYEQASEAGAAGAAMLRSCRDDISRWALPLTPHANSGEWHMLSGRLFLRQSLQYLYKCLKGRQWAWAECKVNVGKWTSMLRWSSLHQWAIEGQWQRKCWTGKLHLHGRIEHWKLTFTGRPLMCF